MLMRPLAQVWIFAPLLGSGVLLLVGLLRDRRLRKRISELERKLGEEMNKTYGLEEAIEEYYIPAWHDATQRLAGPPICTCPPYPYRSSCPKHSPEKRRKQLRALEEAAAKFPFKKPTAQPPTLPEFPEPEELTAGIGESPA